MQEVDLATLKEKIDIVKYVGQFLDLTLSNGEWWGSCPFHQEKTPSFSVNGEKQLYFCYGCHAGGSVIDFASDYNKISFPEAVEKLATEYKIPRSRVPVLVRIAKKYIKKNIAKETIKMEYINNPMLSYDKADIVEWIKEGIPQVIIDKFEVRYDRHNDNIVFPILDSEGKIISIKARTLIAGKKPKYYYYTKIGTVNFLYGYYQNQKAIAEKNEMIIFEGEKSVMKAESYGYFNSVASMTDRIANSIENIILAPSKDIVIAWDKGVSATQIKKEVSLLKKYKNVYILQDTKNLLMPKDAPVDQGKEVFDYLYSQKERVL